MNANNIKGSFARATIWLLLFCKHESFDLTRIKTLWFKMHAADVLYKLPKAKDPLTIFVIQQTGRSLQVQAFRVASLNGLSGF